MDIARTARADGRGPGRCSNGEEAPTGRGCGGKCFPPGAVVPASGSSRPRYRKTRFDGGMLAHQPDCLDDGPAPLATVVRDRTSSTTGWVVVALPTSTTARLSVTHLAERGREGGTGHTPQLDRRAFVTHRKWTGARVILGTSLGAETDVRTVRYLGMSHQDPPLQVHQAMTPNPLVIHPEDDAEPLLALFEGQDFNAVPVVDDGGHLLGMVTKLGLLRLFRVGNVTGATGAEAPASLRVRDIMDTRKVWVEAGDGLDVVVQRMTRYHVRSVPVVVRAGGGRRLVGIVTYRDLRSMVARPPASVLESAGT